MIRICGQSYKPKHGKERAEGCRGSFPIPCKIKKTEVGTVFIASAIEMQDGWKIMNPG